MKMHELFDMVTFTHRWTDTEGGRLLEAKPEAPEWFYVVVSVPMNLRGDSVQALELGRETLAFNARKYAEAHREGVELGLDDSKWTGWVDGDGAIFRSNKPSAVYVAYFMIPTRTWLEAQRARVAVIAARNATAENGLARAGLAGW